MREGRLLVTYERGFTLDDHGIVVIERFEFEFDLLRERTSCRVDEERCVIRTLDRHVIALHSTLPHSKVLTGAPERGSHRWSCPAGR